MGTSSQSRRRGRGSAGAVPPSSADEAVSPALEDGAIALRDFRSWAGVLTLAQRRLLVDQAMLLLERNFVHLELKTAMHAVNPLQRLRLLRVRLDRMRPETMDPEPAFHAELSQTFHSLRDLHTNYLLPSPYKGMVAFCRSSSRSTPRTGNVTTWWPMWPRGSRRPRSASGSR